MNPYEFAIVRYMHDAFAGERVNIGVVLLDAANSRLFWKFNSRYTRLRQLYPNFDGQGYRKIVTLLDSLAEQVRQEHGLDGKGHLFPKEPLALQALLSTLLPQDSASLQPSEVFGGLTDNAQERFEQLCIELIDQNDASAPRERRDAEEIWCKVEALLRERALWEQLSRQVLLTARHYEQSFRVGWNNGVPQYLEPVSMDYWRATDIVDTATMWVGRLASLSKAQEFKFTAVVAPPPPVGELRRAFERAMAILRDADEVRAVVQEDDFESFLPEIEKDLLRYAQK